MTAPDGADGSVDEATAAAPDEGTGGVTGAGSSRRVAVAAFWASVIAVASSSMVTVAALARHLDPGELGAVSTVLGLSFVGAVVPVALQSIAAARRAGTGTGTAVPWRALAPVLIAAGVASPLLAVALQVPVLAVALPVAQVVPALSVAAGRGELIGLARYRALTGNHLVEAVVRVAAGVGLGWLFGATGVALAILLAMLASAAVLRVPAAPTRDHAPVPLALLAIGALTVSIHLDVLLAPRMLGTAAADAYAVAALPAKGVFLALMAAGWLVIPSAVRRTQWDALRQPMVRTTTAGLALAGALVVAMPAVSAVLGRPRPSAVLTLVLGVAMAAAAASWVGSQLLLARDPRALRWPPLAGLTSAAVVVLVTWPMRTADAPVRLAAAVLAGQVATVIATGAALRRHALATPFRTSRDQRRAEWASLARTIDLRGPSAVVVDGPGPRRRAAMVRRVLGLPVVVPGRVGPADASSPGPVDGVAHASSGSASADRPTPRWWLLLASGGITVAMLLQQPGRIVHETKLDVALDPARFLARTLHLWEPAADFGHVQNQAVGYLFPMGPFALFGSAFGVPVWVTQRLFLAALVAAALWGMVRLADRMALGSPATRVVGALAYALAPYVVSRVGNTSAMVTGAAFLPWILLLLVRAAPRGSTRRAGALAGLAVLLTGGVNAAVTVAVLAVPVLWLLTRKPGPRRRSLARWFAVSTALATVWWLLPLFFQQRFGFDFLPYTERSATTTAATPLVDVVRGTADWLSYLRLGDAWIESGWTLVSNPVAIVASGLVAVLGLAGLMRSDHRERTFLVLVLGAGVLAVGAGYGGAAGNPASPVVRSLLDGPAGMFRNVFKFTPLISFALSLGVVHLLAVVRVPRPAALPAAFSAGRVRAVAVGAAAMVVLLGALPLLRGQLVSTDGFAAVPAYWRAVVAYHDANAAAGRSLLVPGAAFGDYQWGRPEDEVLQALSDTPWGVRSLIPLGSAGATRLLDSIDGVIVRGGSDALPEVLARAGVSELIVRNDLDWATWNAPRPGAVRSALVRSGLVRVATFGPTVGELARAGGLTAAGANGSPDAVGAVVAAGEADLRAVEIYAVPRGAVVGTVTASSVSVVSGGPEALLALEEQGLAAGAAVLAGDAGPGDIERLGLGHTWIQTDTLTRRDTEFGLSRDNEGAVLAAGEAAIGGGAPNQLLPYDLRRDPAAERHQTVAEWDGIAGVTASSAGSWLYGIPEAGPASALDGDPATSWIAGTATSSVGEWVQIDLGRPVTADHVDVTLLHDGPWRPTVTRLRTITEAGAIDTELPGADGASVTSGSGSGSGSGSVAAHPVALPLASGPTSWVRVRIEAVVGESPTTARAGLAEVAVPGVEARRVLRLPDDLPVAADGSAPAALAVAVLTRLTAPDSAVRTDEETAIRRRLTTRADASVAVAATARAEPGAALSAALTPPGPLTVAASSVFADEPGNLPGNLLDGDPLSVWIARPLPSAAVTALAPAGAPIDATVAAGAPDAATVPVAARAEPVDPDPSVRLAWPDARPVGEVVLTPVPGGRLPDRVRLTGSDGAVRDADVGADGRVLFPAMRTTSLTLRFPTVADAGAKGEGGTFGLAELRVPAIADLVAPPADDAVPFRLPCDAGPIVQLDGESVPFAVSTTIGQLRRGDPVSLTPCGDAPIALAAGLHDVVAEADPAVPFVIDTIVITPSTEGRCLRPEAPRQATVPVVGWGADVRRVELSGGPTTILTVAENANVGWQATLDGQPLPSIRIDGWKQGYVVPAGTAATVELRFTPAVPYRIALVLGAVLAVLLSVLALWPDRGRRIPPGRLEARPLAPRLAAALVTFAAVWVGGLPGLLALPVVRSLRRSHPVWAARLPVVAFGGAVLVAALQPGRLPGDGTGAFGLPAQVLAVVGMVAAFAVLLPDRRPRRRLPLADPVAAARSASGDLDPGPSFGTPPVPVSVPVSVPVTRDEVVSLPEAVPVSEAPTATPTAVAVPAPVPVATPIPVAILGSIPGCVDDDLWLPVEPPLAVPVGAGSSSWADPPDPDQPRFL